MSLLIDIEVRLNMGKLKYGHGVRITDDMADYTLNGENSFLVMQREEILDGIIYTVASYLRWLIYKYSVEYNSESIDNNEEIISVIKTGVAFTDKISLKYKKLLDGMIKVYKDTIDLEKAMVIE